MVAPISQLRTCIGQHDWTVPGCNEPVLTHADKPGVSELALPHADKSLATVHKQAYPQQTASFFTLPRRPNFESVNANTLCVAPNSEQSQS